MKFECMNCRKVVSSLDSREGEVVFSVQEGAMGNVIGWRIECEECYAKRMKDGDF